MNAQKSYSNFSINSVTAVAALVVLSASCKTSSSTSPNPVAKSNHLIQLTDNRIVDAKGTSLYLLAADVKGDTSNCGVGCATEWPAYYNDSIQVANGLNANDFSTFTRVGDSKKQTAYKGWPLYYFSGDKNIGDVTGDGVEGVWFAAKNYSVMISARGTDVYFSTIDGHSIYHLTVDSVNKSVCTGGCSMEWPPFNSDTLTLPSILQATDFGKVTRADGLKQISYKGQPLYNFQGDANRADTSGQGIGGVWFLVKK